MNNRTRVAIDICEVHVLIDYLPTFLQQNKDKYLFVFAEFLSGTLKSFTYVYMYMLCQSIERIGKMLLRRKVLLRPAKIIG